MMEWENRFHSFVSRHLVRNRFSPRNKNKQWLPGRMAGCAATYPSRSNTGRRQTILCCAYLNSPTRFSGGIGHLFTVYHHRRSRAPTDDPCSWALRFQYCQPQMARL